jgi:hypothetical protein
MECRWTCSKPFQFVLLLSALESFDRSQLLFSEKTSYNLLWVLDRLSFFSVG